MSQDKPFDGAISAFYENDAPDAVRNAIRRADKGDILDPGYPYSERMPRKTYEKEMEALQIELVKLQSWAKSSGARIAIVFEWARRRRQGRYDQAVPRKPEPARRPGRGPVETDRERTDRMVFPALYRPSALGR